MRCDSSIPLTLLDFNFVMILTDQLVMCLFGTYTVLVQTHLIARILLNIFGVWRLHQTLVMAPTNERVNEVSKQRQAKRGVVEKAEKLGLLTTVSTAHKTSRKTVQR